MTSLGDLGEVVTVGGELVDVRGFFGCEGLREFRGEIGGHDAACLEQQRDAEGGGEAADAGEGCDSDGDGEEDEGELAAGGAQLAPGDAAGGGVGETGHLAGRLC